MAIHKAILQMTFLDGVIDAFPRIGQLAAYVGKMTQGGDT